jgi:hypothetical protein
MAYRSDPDDHPFTYIAALVYSVAIAVFWLPALLLRRTARAFLELGTDSWPQANGSTTEGRVSVIHGWIMDYAVARLEYNYQVAGEYYSGEITRQFADEQAAWNFVDPRCAKQVIVRHGDEKPSVSVLRDADQGPSWNDPPSSGLFTMIWQHWRDELRQEDPYIADADADMIPDEDGSDLGEDLEGQGKDVSDSH